VDIEIDTASYAVNNKLIAENANRLGIYHKYLGLLHDSWVLETSIKADKFSITLNDFTTHVFSDVIVEKNKLSIDHHKLVFPLQIEFETTNVTFNTVDEEGTIQNIDPTKINEYLYEQIISFDIDKIEIGLIVWKDGIDNNPGQHILILLSAKNITATEFQDKAWAEIFGTAFDQHYNYFKAQLETGRYLSDQPNCYKLYDEFESLFNDKFF
jgi:hypothetical protein